MTDRRALIGFLLAWLLLFAVLLWSVDSLIVARLSSVSAAPTISKAVEQWA